MRRVEILRRLTRQDVAKLNDVKTGSCLIHPGESGEVGLY